MRQRCPPAERDYPLAKGSEKTHTRKHTVGRGRRACCFASLFSLFVWNQAVKSSLNMSASQAPVSAAPPVSAAKAGSFDCNFEKTPYALAFCSLRANMDLDT
jgi:hypothetical protein